MLKYLRFWLMYPVLMVSMIGLAMGGAWMWLGLAVTLVLMVGGDECLPEDRQLTTYDHPWLLNLALFGTLPFLVVLYLILIWMVAPSGDPVGLARLTLDWTGWDLLAARDGTGSLGIVGGVLSTMMMTGIAGVNVAHELMHRGDSVEKALAQLLEALSFDVPSYISHIQGHHTLVGLQTDPSTSFRGESAYAFLARAIVSANWFSLRAELSRMRSLGRNPLSWRNRFLQGHAMSMAVTALAMHMSGWRGAAIFAVTALLGKSLLELVNYVQHYGLIREEGAPIAPHHSWNCNKRISSYMLCNATRHSSHHVNPQLPFWRAEPMADAPTLRYGYLTSVLIALVPPVWHRVMAPKLLAWDASQASTGERAIAAEHNRRSGLRVLMTNS